MELRVPPQMVKSTLKSLAHSAAWLCCKHTLQEYPEGKMEVGIKRSYVTMICTSPLRQRAVISVTKVHCGNPGKH